MKKIRLFFIFSGIFSAEPEIFNPEIYNGINHNAFRIYLKGGMFMPDYDFYLMTVALLCSQKKPMTAPEIWKSLNSRHGISVSRDKVNYLIAAADSRYGITCEEDGEKPLYTLEWKEVSRSVLLTRNLLTAMQSAYRKRQGSPELQKHLKQFFSEFPALLNADSGFHPAEVYSVCLMQKLLSILRTSQYAVSITELKDRMNTCRPKKEELSSKQIRRIAEKELPHIFFAEVSGSNLHFVRLLPESLIKVFQYFTPADVLALYDFLHDTGVTSLF